MILSMCGVICQCPPCSSHLILSTLQTTSSPLYLHLFLGRFFSGPPKVILPTVPHQDQHSWAHRCLIHCPGTPPTVAADQGTHLPAKVEGGRHISVEPCTTLPGLREWWGSLLQGTARTPASWKGCSAEWGALSFKV